MKNTKKVIALSAIAVLMLGSSAYAGKIISDADLSDILVSENQQFGFGGWNYDNVDVRIVNTSDFSGNVGTFDVDEGTYTAMGADMSFESDIKDRVTGEVLGHLHGKDWPVGEPSGIKIINDDNAKHGKPGNCIMTTSYLAYQDMDDNTSGSGYLDAWPEEPNPVLCSSPFQTHKRYKINMLPSTVEGVVPGNYGKPIDLVFNLDPTDANATIRRYQVLQKANNYTGMRLDGYKVEVLKGDATPSPLLTLSLGYGEGVDKNGTLDGSDIWNAEDMANMSHGLWGAIDNHFDAPGFFDSSRAYYPVTLSEDNQSISYAGDMDGGNYQPIFGNWLPSIWEPTGIFHDDDDNPETDGAIKAFLGVAPGFTERAWYKNSVDITDPKHPVYTWSEATDADFAAWTGPLYEEGPIEDVLNLGLNYIINVGLNAAIGETFILRITPHVAVDQTPPSSYLPSPGVVEGTADFNGDGNADILWKNANTNKVTIWYMNPDGTYVESDIGTVTSDLSIEGVGHFNADDAPAGAVMLASAPLNDVADILWRDASTNMISIWFMNADGTYTQTDYSEVAQELNIEGTGDLDGNGIDDILWRNTSTQEISIWYMNSLGVSTEESLYFTGPAWNIEGVADLDGNGIADILWRSRQNEIGITYMLAEGAYADETLYHTNRKWLIEATGDFDANGIDDILWRNSSTHEIAITYMNGEGAFTDETLYVTGATWNIESVADFDYNGFTDILWRNNPSTGTSSEIAATYMSGGAPLEVSIDIINK